MAWWLQLLPRERLAVVLAALAVLSLLVYQLAWRPLHEQQASLLAQRQGLQQDFLWMSAAGQQIAAYRSNGASAQAASPTRSLLVEADDSLKRSGLAQALQEIKPEGNKLLRVVLKGVPFDATIGWLGYLRQRGIVATSAVFSRVGDTATADVRLTLERAEGAG